MVADRTNAMWLDQEAMTTLARTILERAEDTWDRPAELFALVPATTDRITEAGPLPLLGVNEEDHELVDDHLLRISTGDADPMELNGGGGTAACLLMRVARERTHPTEWLPDTTIPEDTLALFLTTEAWVEPNDVVGWQGHRGPDGRLETRIVTAVSAVGAEAGILAVREGEMLTSSSSPLEAASPLDEPTGIGAGFVLTGRLSLLVRRVLDLPAPPPSRRPWTLPLQVWAAWVLALLDRDQDFEQLARQMVVARPDIVTLMGNQMSEALTEMARTQFGDQVDAADETTVVSMLDEVLESVGRQRLAERFSPGSMLSTLAVETGQLATVTSDLADVLDVLADLSPEIAVRLVEFGWDGLSMAARHLTRANVEFDQPELHAWAGPEMVWSTFAPDVGDAVSALVADERLPAWFRISTRQATEALATIELDVRHEL